MRRQTPADLARNRGHFVWTIWSCWCGRSESPSRPRFARDGRCQTRCCAALTIGARFGARTRATIWITRDAPTITHAMLDLCSAPCKALRFAPPAHARGILALTVPPRRSRLGHYVMAVEYTSRTLEGPLIATLKTRHAEDKHARCARQETHQADCSARTLMRATARSGLHTWPH